MLYFRRTLKGTLGDGYTLIEMKDLPLPLRQPLHRDNGTVRESDKEDDP